MTEELPQIDMSGIDELKDTRQAIVEIENRLQKMLSMKSRFSDVVFQKVKRDYQAQMEGLKKQAEPLKDATRHEYRKLVRVLEHLSEELTQIQFEKEELELRQELGEFSPDVFEKEFKEWELKFTSKQAELDEVVEIKASFLAVFDSEADLEKKPSIDTQPVEEEDDQDVTQDQAEFAPGSHAPSIDLDALENTIDQSLEDVVLDEPQTERPLASDAPQPDEELAVADLEELNPECLNEAEEPCPPIGKSSPDSQEPPPAMATIPMARLDPSSLDLDASETAQAATLPMARLDPAVNGPEPESDLETLVARKQPEPTTKTFSEEHFVHETQPYMDASREATEMMAQMTSEASFKEDSLSCEARLVSNPKIIFMNHECEGRELILGMNTTAIGRSPDNDIHIVEDRVSRKHAQVTFGPGGYALYDLNSENGVYVNGERIREHFLKDGDIIMIGTHKFLYRD